MRTRTRERPYQMGTVVQESTYPYVETFDSTFSYGGSEVIIDDPDVSKITEEKPVLHVRRFEEAQVTAPMSCNITYGPPPTVWNPVQNRITRSNWPAYIACLRCSSQGWFRQAVSSLPESALDVPNIEDRLYTLFERCMPSLNKGLSLVNFVLELKDLRRMFSWETLKNGYTAVTKLPTSVPELIRRLRDRNSGLIPSVASDYLNVSFGWKPFLSDVKKMYEALSNLETRLKEIEQNAGRMVVRHSTMEIVEDLELPSEPWVYKHQGNDLYAEAVNPPYGDMESRIHSRWVYRPRLRMTVRFSYTLPNVSSWRRTVRAYMDALGIKPDWSILWNAIPFSFVVDWVVNVGDWLKSLRPNDLDMVYTVHQCSYSYKHAMHQEHVLQWPTANRPVIESRLVNLQRYIDEVYERRLWIPTGLGINVSIPKGQQWLLGGALAVTIGRKRQPGRRNR